MRLRDARLLTLVGPGGVGYGTYGPKTEAAVKAYQKMQGLATSDFRGYQAWPASAEDEEEGYPLYAPH